MLWDAVLDAQTVREEHSSSLNIQLRRLGRVVVFLRARREVGLSMDLLADREW